MKKEIEQQYTYGQILNQILEAPNSWGGELCALLAEGEL